MPYELNTDQQAELATELTKPVYSGLSDQAAADAINAKNLTAQVPVTRVVAVLLDELPDIELNASKYLTETSPNNVHKACRMLLSVLDRFDEIDTTGNKFTKGINFLNTQGVIPDATKNAVLAVSQNQTSIAIEKGWPEITVDMVAAARV